MVVATFVSEVLMYLNVVRSEVVVIMYPSPSG